MSAIEIIIIGIGLSMDACCVSISNGMSTPALRTRHVLANSLFFGIFQGIMPIIGFFAGSLFVSFLSRYSFWLVTLIFLILGGKMVIDSIRDDGECDGTPITFKILLMQAIATSIDALAVGVSFSAMQVNILTASLLIAVTTFILSALAILLGRKIGTVLNRKAGMLGGILLLTIAVKTFIEGIMSVR